MHFYNTYSGGYWRALQTGGYKDGKKRARGFFRNGRMQNPPLRQEIVDEQKSGQGDEAADSTNSTEPIHSVLQHLRESFSLS